MACIAVAAATFGGKGINYSIIIYLNCVVLFIKKYLKNIKLKLHKKISLSVKILKNDKFLNPRNSHFNISNFKKSLNN